MLSVDFINVDPQPVNWTMHVHSAHDDYRISATILHSHGNKMFEMRIKELIYQCLRASRAPFKHYPRPANPLFLDVGANIGER